MLSIILYLFESLSVRCSAQNRNLINTDLFEILAISLS